MYGVSDHALPEARPPPNRSLAPASDPTLVPALAPAPHASPLDPGRTRCHSLVMATGRRTQQDRDEITVEIGYALLSACFLGGVMLAAIAGPALVWDLSPAVDRALLITGASAGGMLAVLRVVHVLWQFGQRRP